MYVSTWETKGDALAADLVSFYKQSFILNQMCLSLRKWTETLDTGWSIEEWGVVDMILDMCCPPLETITTTWKKAEMYITYWLLCTEGEQNIPY